MEVLMLKIKEPSDIKMLVALLVDGYAKRIEREIEIIAKQLPESLAEKTEIFLGGKIKTYPVMSGLWKVVEDLEKHRQNLTGEVVEE
jgi:hypothetical protein